MDTLLTYLEDADNASFADVRLHIASCQDCRAKLHRLNKMQDCLRKTGPYQNRLAAASPQLANALDQQAIERYIDGELQAPESAPIKQLLDTDPSALKAALHYASHSAASGHLLAETEQTIAAPSTTTAAVTKPVSNANALMEQLKKLFYFRTPIWISVPATAAVVFVMTLAVMPSWIASSSQGITVASYQDKAVIHYQGTNQLPGIGFFSKAHRSTESFGAMEIRYDDKHALSLHWPQVPNATTYHLALYLISEGQKITVQELDLEANQGTIANFKPETGKRYEWTLNGETTDAKSFYTTGGFVINTHQ
jgi:anti-sigma factor RsiW